MTLTGSTHSSTLAADRDSDVASGQDATPRQRSGRMAARGRLALPAAMVEQ